MALLLWTSVHPNPVGCPNSQPCSLPARPSRVQSCPLLTPPTPEKLIEHLERLLRLLLTGVLTPQGPPVAGSQGAQAQLSPCCYPK